MQRTWIPLCALTSLLVSGSECLAQSEYNTAFFHGTGEQSFINLIDPDSGIIPGTYSLDVYVNRKLVEQRDVEIVRDKPDSALHPCISADRLRAWSVALPADDDEPCYPLERRIAGASMNVTMTEHRLDIQVPQLNMLTQPRGTVPATRYDEGINAAFVNYNLAANTIRSYGQNSQYAYLYLNNGINIGAWRLRQMANLTKRDGETGHWKNVSSWAERALPSLRSRLLLGQGSTGTTLYDSIPFRGVQLASEPMMRADSQSRYAPVVRGVAESNARVEVRQNKYLIYSTNVPPGPFAFDDIVPVSQSGDLFVTIIETDGRKTNLVIPYTVLPGLVRKGQWNYEITAAKYHDGADGYAPAFVESQLARGMSDTVTLSGGLLSAEHYRSAAMGVGKNMGHFGAVSVDLALSDTRLARGDDEQGGSARFLYAKSFLDSRTDFQVAGYRYSSSGYYDFQESVQERRRWDNGRYKTYYWDDADQDNPDWVASKPEIHYDSRYATKKARLDISMSQQIGEISQLYLTFSKQSYWQDAGSDTTVQSGFTSRLGNVTWSLYYQNTRNHYIAHDSSINLRLSLPLSFGSHPATATTDLHADRAGNVSSSAGLSGSLLEDNRLSYAMQVQQNDAEGTAGDLSMGYKGGAGNLWLGYSRAEDVQQSSMNLSGGILAHAGGVTLSQPPGSTFTLIEAQDAQGVRVENQAGVRIDAAGYAVAPHAIPYRNNTWSLNTLDFPEGLDVPVATQNNVPTRGAITRVTFETYRGDSVLIHSKRPDNSVPPVGAQAYSRGERNNGIVGPDGDIFVSGVLPGEAIAIRWGEGDDEQCRIQLPDEERREQDTAGYREISAICR
ncbi:fimbria/pilus outer membrane usher protein [Enterobacter quasiroggenkampii]